MAGQAVLLKEPRTGGPLDQGNLDLLGLTWNGEQAHIKSALIGASVSIPISNGKLATGTWQGIWFLEFRDGKQRRKVLATVQGEKM